LQAKGFQVVSAPISLTSLSDDVKALEGALERISGPFVLGAHAYSGAVVSAIASDRLKGLVFVTALTPDEGETVAEVFIREPPHLKAPRPAWKSKPSWYLIAEEDRMINPKAQRYLPERMKARTRSEKVDHTPMVTAPAPVVEMFLEALATCFTYSTRKSGSACFKTSCWS
jgi:hypothetical protein